MVIFRSYVVVMLVCQRVFHIEATECTRFVAYLTRAMNRSYWIQYIPRFFSAHIGKGSVWGRENRSSSVCDFWWFGLFGFPISDTAIFHVVNCASKMIPSNGRGWSSDQSDRSHSSLAGDQAIPSFLEKQHETRDSFLKHQPKYPLIINCLVVWNMFFSIYWE